MTAKGVGWVGLYTPDPAPLGRMLTEVLGSRLEAEAIDFSVYRFPNGDKVEVFGPRGPQPPWLFESGSVVPGFLVGDIDEAKARVVAAGLPLLGPTREDSGYRWQHFRGPDGVIYELTYDPFHPAVGRLP
jgi:catechol 2,3-dioxygenase-like lactoylglutathione lyase family enzyme